MATNIPPHNLGEVIDGTLALIENPDLSTEALMEIIPAPDFPTGGMILGRSGARKAYLEGRGVGHHPREDPDRGNPQGPLRHHHRRDSLSGEQGRG